MLDGEEKRDIHLNNVLKTAENYAVRRQFSLSKGNPRCKIHIRDVKQELVVASVYGELSCLERILTMIQQNPDMDRTEIEAELHLAIVDYNEFVRKFTGYGLNITLDGYLGLRGYYNKEGLSCQTSESESGK